MLGSGDGRFSNSSNLSVFSILSTFSDFGFIPLAEGMPGSGAPRFSSRLFILATAYHIKVKCSI